MVKKVSTFQGEDDSSKVVYLFSEKGKITAVFRYDKRNKLAGEQTWFYSSGKLQSKLNYSNTNLLQGNAYFFYENSGALKSDRYFRNGKEVIWGAEYWNDSFGTIKTSVHFDDTGRVIYKKHFDERGNFIGEEGSKEK